MSESNVISIRDVLKRMRHPGESDEPEELQAVLRVEDCGDGFAYMTVARRMRWQDAIEILNQYYCRTP